ncbi:MAG: hypothetical protein AAF720_06460 [Pseudomonadota bacterium]
MANFWFQLDGTELKPKEGGHGGGHKSVDEIFEEKAVPLAISNGLKVSEYDILNRYTDVFKDNHQQLIRHCGKDNFSFSFLPASLEFGETKIKNVDHEITAFDSVEEIKKKGRDLSYEQRNIARVMKQTSLATATVKTVRAVRLELYKGFRLEKWGNNSPVINSMDPQSRTGTSSLSNLYDHWNTSQ